MSDANGCLECIECERSVVECPYADIRGPHELMVDHMAIIRVRKQVRDTVEMNKRYYLRVKYTEG